ncbi:RNA-binding protein [Candidatus Saccharibacteria bacterium]|nr:RNA-binding protein [Candidatus Saccharibacteria bacterium]MCB9834760.1 RNA-binding protein [Candidatus Nomurabacteria bacterium]
MVTKLYVGGIPYSATEQELEEFFSVAGSVVSARIITDRETNRSKGFGFVEMSTQEEAQQAITMLHDKDMGGRKITVNEARPKEDRPARRF